MNIFKKIFGRNNAEGVKKEVKKEEKDAYLIEDGTNIPGSSQAVNEEFTEDIDLTYETDYVDEEEIII